MHDTPREALGEVLTFRDITVVPYDVILQRESAAPFEHCGGPIYPDWDRQVGARFCRDGRPVDTRPPAPVAVAARIDEPCVWGDACYGHFGHQIVDFGTRILHGVTALPQATFLFAGTRDAGIGSLAEAPAFFRALLDWYGVPPARVRFITEPTHVNELHVPPQAEQLFSIGPSAAYLDLQDAVVAGHFGTVGKAGTLFVSRAGQPYCLAGEGYLETLLLAVGIRVLRPELLPLHEQLLHYCSAEHLIFTEGSALHGLQLLGRVIGDVTVLQRRHQPAFPRASFERRARRVEYLNLLAGLVHGLRVNGRDRLHEAISLFDEEAMVSYLRTIDPRLVPLWDSARYREARDRDIRRWLEVESRNPASRAPGSGVRAHGLHSPGRARPAPSCARRQTTTTGYLTPEHRRLCMLPHRL